MYKVEVSKDGVVKVEMEGCFCECLMDICKGVLYTLHSIEMSGDAEMANDARQCLIECLQTENEEEEK